MTEVIVFKTATHSWCLPTSEVVIRRGSTSNNCGIRFLGDSHSGQGPVGSTTCYDVERTQMRVYPSMDSALRDEFYWA